ncbi:MAG TPA: TrmH family RNA methyltransferase [Vicinamibacteria bacterium]
MDLNDVDVVLVRPARPANVAAACRALKNMGLSRLTLVGMTPGDIPIEARALAYGAWDLLDGARSVASLEEAVAEVVTVVGTTGRDTPGAQPARELASRAASLAGGGRLALVFGPESTGLTRRELALCHHTVHVPTSPEHPSLNLAQAVLLLAYELRLAALAGAPGAAAPRPRVGAATAGDMEQALGELRTALLAIGYLNPANPEAILAELRQILVRAAVTPREVTLLRGMARQIAWAAGR